MDIPWLYFSTSLLMVEKFHHTFVGGIFHHIRLQCTDRRPNTQTLHRCPPDMSYVHGRRNSQTSCLSQLSHDVMMMMTMMNTSHCSSCICPSVKLNYHSVRLVSSRPSDVLSATPDRITSSKSKLYSQQDVSGVGYQLAAS